MKFSNPYKRGIYKHIIEALDTLGRDRWHSFRDFKTVVRTLMSCGTTTIVGSDGEKLMVTEWEKFENRPCRNIKTGKDVNGRLIQNVETLQRLNGQNAYGRKLKLVGACVDIGLDDDGLEIFRLRTKFPKGSKRVPINKRKRLERV